MRKVLVGTHRIRRSRDIGVYWEIYGLEGEEVDLALVITGQTGLIRRLAAALGLGERNSRRPSPGRKCSERVSR